MSDANASMKKILVTGDVCWDHVVYQGQERRPGATMCTGTEFSCEPGGACLLHGILQQCVKRDSPLDKQETSSTKSAEVKEASADHTDSTAGDAGQHSPDTETTEKEDPEFSVVLGVEKPATNCDNSPRISQGGWLLEPFPTSRDDKKTKHWRVKSSLGTRTPPQPESAQGTAAAQLREYDVIAIADDSLEFRREPSKPAWPLVLKEVDTTKLRWIVLKHAAPITSGDLWHHLVSKCEAALTRTVCIVSIGDLCTNKVRVSQQISWERAALDLSKELLSNPDLEGLRRSRFVIVNFDTDGALLADFSDGDNPGFELVYDPENLEGDWSDAVPGGAYGLQCSLAAAVTAKLPLSNDGSEAVHSALIDGIKSGLSAMRRLYSVGHGAVSRSKHKPAFPFAAIAGEIGKPTWHYSSVDIPGCLLTEDKKCKPGTPSKAEEWSIVGQSSGSIQKSGPLYGLGRRVALQGTSALTDVPYQQFGYLFTVDRSEIESLRIIQKLIVNYRDQNKGDKPLSLAVFGPPGSGKSFGVKQISEAVLGEAVSGKRVPILEFNLSQFDEPDQLIGLFHQIRDKVLEGTMPVVFWDEFDSQKYKWLQYLLAPMQDGAFQEGQLSHPIGKCVFVFAGGTSDTFETFGPKRPGENASEEGKKNWEEFKAKKGPDFKSRLNGFLNVAGPNKNDAIPGGDISYPVRRALLLRGNLRLGKNQRLAIDPGLLTAFLEVPEYKHGARSMKNIAEQTRDNSPTGEALRRSDAPAASLLELYVDADKFLSLMERDLEFQYDVGEMAKAYHDYYWHEFPPAPGSDAAEFLKENFDDLKEFLKDDNRAAAKRIGEVLGLVGLYLTKEEPKQSDNKEVVRQIIERNIDLLAEAEHDGWMESRLRNGWRFDEEEKSFAKRLHSRLVPYRNLPRHEQEKDHNAVRRYPAILARNKTPYYIVTERPDA